MPPSFANAAKTGRPFGKRPAAQSKPSTIAEFVTQSLADPPKAPPKPPKTPRTPGRSAGVWDDMTLEERSAYARQLASRRDPKNMARPYNRARVGVPDGWTGEAVAVARTTARLEATELVQKLKAQGTIPSDDPEGEAATIEALTILRSPGGMQRKAKYAKRLLRFYHPELAASLV